MLHGLFIASLIGGCCQAIKEALVKPIPAENWANKELYNEDLMNGVPMKQIMKNVENGKYKLNEKYPEPHRDKDGKIVVENCNLYFDDVREYGAYQAYKWMQQGKYNLTPEELKKQNEDFEKKYEFLYKIE